MSMKLRGCRVSKSVDLFSQALNYYKKFNISVFSTINVELELFRRQRISVKSEDSASVSFLITPKKLGYIQLKVSATSSIARDGVSRQLLVRPEGETVFEN